MTAAGPNSDPTSEQVPVRVLGGPTVLIEYGGLRLLTDPTFDAPGDYPSPSGRVLTKTAPPRLTPAELGPVDVVLLSHDQHADNLDHSGRALLAEVPRTLTTPSAAGRLGGTARALAPWESVELPRPDGGTVTVTAAPGLHGPKGSEPIVGEVTGFVLTSADLPTVYVSGDNASLELVQEIADRYAPVDTAVLFAGAPRLPVLDDALLVLDGAGTATAARLLDARRVVPAHCDSWAHFTETRQDVVAAFAEAGLTERLQLD
ncbi:MBL fold metallo-hydrolase [Streptomyces sp. NPDC016566]|uniref:MBL fold metallo-hydrolase n=1 Tax=unclassified Streptomyces TaxID=2593676 RepID=UPI00119FB936|nr:MBL fold metallo-hydrolase [Streptomyces sp. BK340]TVZ81401.1 L-ascorbate metabolism protein UlaG (beta-lactamase superfamily) [Streptomyces sp. BK340]